jgi:hypothetical protein
MNGRKEKAIIKNGKGKIDYKISALCFVRYSGLN